MKLNHDCIRDLLLFIEENATLTDVLFESSFLSSLNLQKYNEDEVYYTLLKVKEAGLINGDVMILSDYRTLVVKSLTFDGHSFLDNIRDDKVWNKTKEKISSSVTSVSISVVGQVAASVIKSLMGMP